MTGPGLAVASIRAMSSGMIAACFSPGRLAAHLLGPGYWRPYPAAQDRGAWDAVHQATRGHLPGRAARLLAGRPTGAYRVRLREVLL